MKELRRFHNALRILMSIDMAEFIQAVYQKDYGEFGDVEKIDWCRFASNPHVWFIQAPDAHAEAIWKLIERRQGK